jgi:hypothetical protein
MSNLGSTRQHDENTQGAVRHWRSVHLRSSTGSINANINAASSRETWSFGPSATSTFRAFRLLVTVEDEMGFQADEYGNLGSSLGTGLLIQVSDSNGTKIDLCDGVPITKNSEWAHFFHDVDVKSWGVTPTNELLTARWTFAKAGVPIRLEGSESEELQVILQDDFSALLGHFFVVQGYCEEGDD